MEQAKRIQGGICLETLGYTYTTIGSNKWLLCSFNLRWMKMLKALHHQFGCNSQAGVLRVFTPADVSISNATATGTKKSQAERYLACGAIESTFSQTETRPALTGFRKTAHTHTPKTKKHNKTVYCGWIGDVTIQPGKVCIFCTQTPQNHSSNPAVLSEEAGVPFWFREKQELQCFELPAL